MNPLLESRGSRPRKGTVLICPRCSKEFYVGPSQTSKRKYCSHECKVHAESHKVASECLACGKSFTYSLSCGKKWCSWDCYLKSRERKEFCQVCGVPLTGQKVTYCSHACRAEGKRGHLKRPCAVCGKVMAYQQHQAETKKYCSRACAHEGKRLAGPGWKYTRKDGYVSVYFPTHPDTTKSGFMLEHRLIAEQKYGRRLLKTEQVHHIDGDPANNDPSNLEVVSPTDHQRITSQQGVQKRKNMRDRLAEYEKRFGPLA